MFPNGLKGWLVIKTDGSIKNLGGEGGGGGSVNMAVIATRVVLGV